MKKVTFITILLLCFYFSSHGQEQKLQRKNAVFAEGAGAIVLGAGLVYERYFYATSLTNLSLRGGIGLVESFSRPSPHIGGSVLFGKKFYLEAGANYISNPYNFDTNTALQTLVGFRYQNFSDGFLFRIFYVLPVGIFLPESIYIPYGGISLGYAF